MASGIKSVLVTGGAGYVGSHTAALLVERGYEVDIFDNLTTGHADAVPDGSRLILGDLADAESIQAILANGAYDAVLHFAALSLVGESMKHPYRYLSTNYVNALNLLDAMAEAGTTRFVLSSTANLFGEADSVIGESAAISPGSPYGESKYAIERALEWAERIHKIRHASLRYFNAAGADPDGKRGEDHDPETHLIPLVLQVALGLRNHIDVFGNDYPTPDGSCVRDYVHVCDLAEAHILALDSLDDGSCKYNLGTGHGYSVYEVIDAARTITGHEIPARIAPRRPGDPPRLVADPARISGELGWTPRFGLAETMETAWNWHRNNPDGFVVQPDRAVGQ